METKHKLLVCGDIKGNFNQLFNRVVSINKKSGPFELLLCVGNFFGASNDELEAYKNGNKNVPVPTYILGANSEQDCKEYSNLNEGEICTNLTYLGKRGLYTLASGIKIAYISGIEVMDNIKTEWNFDKEDVKAVKNLCVDNKNSMGEYRGVDILLTSQWPQGISEKELNSSKLLSWLAFEIKPRYHFCGLNEIYYERLPYRNPAGPNSQLELTSRFISLSTVGNTEKSKYLYAFNIVPVDKLRIIDLIQKTTNETSCPYNLDCIEGLSNQPTSKSEQYFYDTKSFSGNDERYMKRKGFGYDGETKRQRPVTDPEKCWFCLSSSSIEKQLVISTGDNYYLALPKGPISENHILILSVTHIQSTSLLSGDDWNILAKLKASLRKYFKEQNKTTIFFERNYKSSHLQINVIAVENDKESEIKHSFEDKANEYNIHIENIPQLTAATELPQKGPYFVAELPDGITLLTRQMKMFPIHFGREVFCAEGVLNCENKVDWRECLLSKEDEVLLVKKYRQRFKTLDLKL